MAYGYATARDSETWQTIGGETREEAAALAWAAVDALAPADLADAGSTLIYICERHPVDKAAVLCDAIDAANILDSADEDGGSDVWPWWDDSAFDPSVAGLQMELERAARRWLEQYPGPDIWTSANITEHRR